MGRFLLYFSYVGADFCGMQKQSNTLLPSVAGSLEKAFECLRPANEIRLVTSSRTDRGVHALCNTSHIDLTHRNPDIEYTPRLITEAINQRMFDYRLPIRLIRTQRVSDEFHCRFCARARTYVYRVAVSRDPSLGWCLPFTPFEYEQAFFVKEPMDMSLVDEAGKLLTGTHNFLGFSSPTLLVDQPWINPVKTLNVSIRESTGFMQQYMPYYTENFINYDFIFHGKSFLYRQVRKMVGAMLGAGRGMISLSDIECVLASPEDNRLRKTNIFNIPAHALYLAQVHYDEEDLRDPTEGEEQQTSNSDEEDVDSH